MQPNQPNQPNPYDFIMNSQTPPPRQPLGGGSSMGVRIAIVAGGVLILLMMGIILASLLTGGDKAQNQRLLELAQKETEIIRLTDIADKDAKTAQTQSFAATTRISLQSSQTQTKKLLNARGTNEKALNKQLGGGKNEKNDKALTDAKNNNRFDETFNTLISTQLTDYQKLVRSAYESGSASEKIALQKSYNNVGELTKKREAPPVVEVIAPSTSSESSSDSSDEEFEDFEYTDDTEDFEE